MATSNRHGTERGYKHDGCRCDLCKAANTKATRDDRARRHAQLAELPDSAHGDRNTYLNWGCRCQRCTDTQKRYMRTYRERYRRAGWDEAIAALRVFDRFWEFVARRDDADDPSCADRWAADYLTDQAPKVDGAAPPKVTEHDHRRAGPGYWSPLCMYRWDGCTDERCVCACHNRAPAQTPAADKPKEEPQ